MDVMGRIHLRGSKLFLPPSSHPRSVVDCGSGILKQQQSFNYVEKGSVREKRGSKSSDLKGACFIHSPSLANNTEKTLKNSPTHLSKAMKRGEGRQQQKKT